jgi:hypothetical protein
MKKTAEGRAKISAAKKPQLAPMQAQSPNISPHTKLPVEHPESQAVERVRYDMQISLNSHPDHKDDKD